MFVLAAVLGCGGPASPGPSPAPVAGSAGSHCELRVAEAIYADSVWPVEKSMCRTDVADETCREVCRAADDLRVAASHICGREDSRASERECRESRALARRATTTCAFCSGTMTRRPCHDLF